MARGTSPTECQVAIHSMSEMDQSISSNDLFHELERALEAHPGLARVIADWQVSDSDDLEELTGNIYSFAMDQKIGGQSLRQRYTSLDNTYALEDEYSRYSADLLCIAANTTECQIRELPVDGRNCTRILNFIRSFISPNGYGALIEDYAAYLEPEEYMSIFVKSSHIFVDELVDRWREIARSYELNTTSNPTPPISLLLQDLSTKVGKVEGGVLIRANRHAWNELIARFSANWELAYQVPAEKWEEIIAAAFDAAGYDRVILTPRSRDHGRDVIAEKHGFGAVKIAISVKAYSRDRIVPYDDVRALAGVIAMDTSVSKGMITTLSNFPPLVAKDPLIAPLLPFRLELVNGLKLRQWLRTLKG